jgi:hypothetical protein
MENILLTIFSIEENIYLAYRINIDDSSFFTVNFAEMIQLDQIEIPFLNDIEKIRNIFPEQVDKDEIFVGLTRNNQYSVIVFAKDEKYLPISKNIFRLVQNTSLVEKRAEIELFIDDLLTNTVEPELQNLITTMNNELSNYSSFISIYDYNSEQLVISTLHKKKDENNLAREVFRELKRLNLIKKNDLEVELKKIGGSVQVFYFYIKGLVCVVYCINVQVNTGIIRLKLKTFLRNKEIFAGINTKQSQSKNILNIVDEDFSDENDTNIKYFKLRIKFNSII